METSPEQRERAISDLLKYANDVAEDEVNKANYKKLAIAISNKDWPTIGSMTDALYSVSAASIWCDLVLEEAEEYNSSLENQVFGDTAQNN